MRFNMLLVLAVAIPGIAMAQAQGAESTPAPTPKKDKPVKERMSCRPIPNSTSRMAPSVCHTKAEWEAISKANSNDVDRIRRQ